MNDFVHIRNAAQLIWKRRLRFLVPFAILFVTVVVVTFSLQPTYEATSILLVKFGREYIYRPEVGDREALLDRDREVLLNAEIEILQSRDLHEKVVTTLGPETLYPELAASPPPVMSLQAAAADKFDKALFVQGRPEAAVIHVSFRHNVAETAAMAVNVLVDLFREKHLQTFSDPQTTAFLEEKVSAYRRSLDESEEALKVFQLEHKFVSLDENRELLQRQRRELQALLREAQTLTVGLSHKVSFLSSLGRSGTSAPDYPQRGPRDTVVAKKEVSDPPASPLVPNNHEQIALTLMASDPDTDLGTESTVTAALFEQARPLRAVDDANARLLELQLKEKELLESYRETNRNVASVREQIRTVESFLREQETRIGPEPQSELISALAELRFQQARTQNVDRQLAQLDAELQDLPQLEQTYRDLVRERDTVEESYRTFSKKLEEARLSEEMDRQKIANISVIQKGVVPAKPIAPRKKLNIAVGFLLAVALGLGCALYTKDQAPA